MENAEATSEPQVEAPNDAATVTKPAQEQQQQQQVEVENELKQQQQHQRELQQPQKETQIEKPGEDRSQQDVHIIDDYDEDDDDDDDEEKKNSQKLIIDIPDEDEENNVEDDDEDVIAVECPPQTETPKLTPKPNEVDAIITLSDGEEDIPTNEVTSKPEKVQKRRSAGVGQSAISTDDESNRSKRRKSNAAGTQKVPRTGYVRHMQDRRESMRKEHPSKTSMDHSKTTSEECHGTPTDIKSSNLKATDMDKQRYAKKMHNFAKAQPDLSNELDKSKARKATEINTQNELETTTTTTTAISNSTTAVTTKSSVKEKSQTNEHAKFPKETTATATTIATTKEKAIKEPLPMPSTSQQATERTTHEKAKRKRTPTPPTSTATATTTISTATTGEIPIFTNEFLEHNKIYDMELRTLRKSKTDLEQQNSVLEKHVENMKFGVEKMITENNELEEKNRLLEIYLDKLKRKLAMALGALPLPSAPNGATVDNIDKYMQDLYKMSTSNSHGPATLNKAKDIIRKLDLQIQL